MNRSKVEELIKTGITLSDDIIVRSGKKDTVTACSGLTVKETSEGLRAYMVFEMPKTPRAIKEITAKSKKGGK